MVDAKDRKLLSKKSFFAGIERGSELPEPRLYDLRAYVIKRKIGMRLNPHYTNSVRMKRRP